MRNKIFLFLLFTSILRLSAQPEQYDGAIVVNQIYIGDQMYMPVHGRWVNVSGSGNTDTDTLSVKRYFLSRNGVQSKKELPKIDPSKYNFLEMPSEPYALLIPPYVGKRESVNQRVIFTFDGDTMIVDFINIPVRLSSKPIRLGSIHFKPGKYTYDFYGKSGLAPKDKMESLWLNYYRYQGIAPHSEQYLIKYGMLTYTPPRDTTSVWKYEIPKVLIERISPYEVFIQLRGFYFFRISLDTNIEYNLNTYFRIEVFENGKWKEKPYGIGLDVKKEKDVVVLKYFNERLIQLISNDKVSLSGFDPGRYRVKFRVSKEKILESDEFVLGMVKHEGKMPYVNLFRGELGYPKYHLDYFKNIHIQTPFLPSAFKDSMDVNHSIHHFHYFFAENLNSAYYPRNPEEEYLKQFISLVSSKKLFVNDEVYEGRIKFAFSSSKLGVTKLERITDIYIIDYFKGTPVKVEILKDVDLLTEEKIER